MKEPTTILALLGSVVVLAVVYQVVTSKQTSGIINAASTGFSGILRAATGK